MRIYAVADIHAREDRLRGIRDTVQELTLDVLVIAGDLCRFRRRPEVLLEQLEELPVPILAIRGNSDPERIEDLFEIYPNITPLHLRAVEVAGVPFVGAGGTLPLPFATRIGWQDRVIEKSLTDLLTSQSVLVVHPPPRDILDRVLGHFHAGCRTVSRVIAAAAPRLVLCGHIHEQPGYVALKHTVVVNCSLGHGGGALVEIVDGERPRVKML